MLWGALWEGLEGPVLQPMTPDPGNPGNSRETRIVPNRRFASTKPHVLREFRFNSRHPDPRRVWKRGPVLQPMTPDPGNNRE